MKLKFVPYLFLFSAIFSSCTTTVEQPVSTGRNAEILIYTDKKIWNSPLGDSIRAIFMETIEGLNQPEPMFRLLHLQELDDLFIKHRNILRIVVSDTVKEATLAYSDNLFAKPQTYIEAFAPDYDEMANILRRGKKILFEKFRQTDYARILHAFKMQQLMIVVI